ncbi:hypothetical protein ACFFKU_17615 [Kineococcus gynurae]|uniref:Uncharacterized protein n=1 Tax=Kineococcus gynurae TaxID=452979 RepID=A0ABV5LNU2_9ACTN
MSEITPALRRRSFLLGGAAGIGAGLTTATAAHAANANNPNGSPIPTLPGEVWRDVTRYSRIGKKPYEVIDVLQDGDMARLYVPWTAKLKGMVPGALVWYYHTYGWSYTSMDRTYAYPGMLCVDQDAVSICPDYGGNIWTSERAISLQRTWSTWATNTFSIGRSFARSHSGGCALMIYAYGKNMLRNQRGIYVVNGVYDMEDMYARSPETVGPAYNNDPVAIATTNPARFPQTAWTGKRLKIIVSEADTMVPPGPHGLALAEKASPVAVSCTTVFHDDGHNVPAFVNNDMMITFRSWA